MHRRRLIKGLAYGTGALALGAGAGTWWLTGPKSPVVGLADLGAGRRWLTALATSSSAHSLTEWPLPQVLEHCAQSIEFSLHGFPQAKPEWFQSSAGALAFAAFNRCGQMSHSLTEPIPGAPELQALDLARGAGRLERAFIEFEAHRGPLAPHFAYGALDKAHYTRAHLMHLANHAEKIRLS